MTRFSRISTLRKSVNGSLPNLIVIGAQKCATTSLHYYLNLHPQISMSKEKELNFFIRERNWKRGIEWYRSHFNGKGKVRGESSPNYTMYPIFNGVSERIHSVLPETKLIYILRDPIDRIVSNYVQAYVNRKENRRISQALSDLESNHYIWRSKYFMQLRQYLNYFPSSNILIITLEDLFKYRKSTMKDVFRFLKIDETFYSPKFMEIKHESPEKGQKNQIGLLLKRVSELGIARLFSTNLRMTIGKAIYSPFSGRMKPLNLDQNLRRKLSDFLKDDIDSLRKHTGFTFPDWSV